MKKKRQEKDEELKDLDAIRQEVRRLGIVVSCFAQLMELNGWFNAPKSPTNKEVKEACEALVAQGKLEKIGNGYRYNPACEKKETA